VAGFGRNLTSVVPNVVASNIVPSVKTVPTLFKSSTDGAGLSVKLYLTGWQGGELKKFTVDQEEEKGEK
jgi:hypothetical protein